MKKIGILLVESLPLPPVKGGAVENLVQLIIDNNEKSEDLDIYVFSKYDVQAVKKTKDYKHTKYIYTKSNAIFRCFDFCLKVVRRVFRNFLHVNTPSLYEIVAYRYFKQLGIETLVLANCPAYAIYQNRKKEFHIVQYLHNDYINSASWQNNQIFKHTQEFIVVSNFIKLRVESIAPSNIPINVCNNGLNLHLFKKAIDKERRSFLLKQLGLSHKDIVIMFTGRLVRNKGVKELLLAFDRIQQKHDYVKLVIIGGTSFSQNTKDAYVKELTNISQRLNGKVVFTGYVNYSEIADYLKLASVVVVPSMGNEAFSLSTLEAMASGIPVVVSDAGGTLEVIDEDSGIVVKRGPKFVEGLASAIVSVVFNDERHEEMSKAALQRSNCFTDEKMYKRFVELLK